jgi:hypothetical protein
VRPEIGRCAYLSARSTSVAQPRVAAAAPRTDRAHVLLSFSTVWFGRGEVDAARARRARDLPVIGQVLAAHGAGCIGA